MDKAVENALRRRDALSKEIEEIELFISLHKKFGGNVEQDVPNSAQSASEREKATERPVRVRGRPDDFADLMEQILREKRHPLSRPDFVDELERLGYDIPSDDKPRYLGTILWRHSKRFRNLPKFGYWLIGEPYQPARYKPSTDTELQCHLDIEADIVEPPLHEEGTDDDAR